VSPAALLSTVGVLVVLLAAAGQQVRAADGLLSVGTSPSDLLPSTQAANGKKVQSAFSTKRPSWCRNIYIYSIYGTLVNDYSEQLSLSL